MKKLLKSKICGSLNSTRDPHVAENWLKSQTFWLKKKKKKDRNANASGKRKTHRRTPSHKSPDSLLELVNMPELL